MEHIVLLIRVEKRLNLDNIDTMNYVVSENNIEISLDNIRFIFRQIRLIIQNALNDKFSFLKGE